MKIAVYGDSFAASTGDTSWTSIMKSRFDTTVYAIGGTSLFWSYKNFIETYDQFDTIIFLVTDYGRLYTAEVKPYACNLFCAEQFLKEHRAVNKDTHDTRIAAAAIDYYTYLQDREYEMTVHRLLIEKIINLCQLANKSLFLVPCMSDSIPADIETFFQYPFSLSQVNNMERQHFDIPQAGMFAENKFRLQNHLTDDNNLILAEILIRLIQGENLKINIHDFNLTPVLLDDYYDKQKLMEIKNENTSSR